MPVSISNDITSYLIDNEVLLFSAQQQQLYHLNSSAALMWICYEDGLDETSIAHEIASAFGIPPELAKQDLKDIFAKWEAQGLLSQPSSNAVPVQQIRRKAPEETSLVKMTMQSVEPMNCKIEHGYSLLNSSFIIRCNQPEIEMVIHSVIGHLETPSLSNAAITLNIQQDKIGYSLFRDGELTSQCKDKKHLGPLIHAEVLSETYNNTDFLIAIHAAAISNGQECIVLPAGSGSGKSTLTAALVQSGYKYCTDELVFLNRQTNSIQAATAGIAIKSGSWPILKAYYPHIDEVPTYIRQDRKEVRYLIPSTEILPDKLSNRHRVSSLVFPTYKPEIPTCLSAISPADALCRLASSGYDMTGGLDKERVAELISWIQGMNCYELHTQNLPDAISAIGELFP